MAKPSRTFVIGDTHFDHEGMCHYLNPDDSKLRPWDNVEDMNNALIERWNDVVRPQDRVIHLGDFGWARRSLHIISQLHGRKHLVLGNHDVFHTEEYLSSSYTSKAGTVRKVPGFLKVHGALVENHTILTHIPVHPSTLGGRFRLNIHGHLHNSVICNPDGTPDQRYINVSCEQTDFRPVLLAELVRQHYLDLICAPQKANP